MSLTAIQPSVKRWIVLDFSERIILAAIGAVFVLNALLMLFRGGAIDTGAYATLFAIALGVGAVGQFYRQSGRSEAAASALTCTAFMILFSNAALVLNFLLLPLSRPSIDPLLMQIDGWLGYSWPAAVAFAADHPLINAVAKYAYMSTMPQITLLILVLGFAGRKKWLHLLLLSIVFTTIALVAFWALFPSHGPTAFQTLPTDVLATAKPLVASTYGREMLVMAVEGKDVVTPGDVEGLIAFPSYHTTLAFICMFCALGMRPLFPFFLLLNLAILPGTLFHGGHHLVDLPAGFVLFVLGIVAARWVMNRDPATYAS